MYDQSVLNNHYYSIPFIIFVLNLPLQTTTTKNTCYVHNNIGENYFSFVTSSNIFILFMALG